MTAEQKLEAMRILLVEDEYFIAQDLRRSFIDAGADIFGPVPTVNEALALFESAGSIDGAVLDINLRGETVYPLVDRLAEAGVRTVFVTGYDAREIPARYRHIVRCEKPLSMEKVIAALKR